MASVTSLPSASHPEASLIGLHRVTNPEIFPHLMTVWNPENDAALRTAYRPKLWPG